MFQTVMLGEDFMDFMMGHIMFVWWSILVYTAVTAYSES